MSCMNLGDIEPFINSPTLQRLGDSVLALVHPIDPNPCILNTYETFRVFMSKTQLNTPQPGGLPALLIPWARRAGTYVKRHL